MERPASVDGLEKQTVGRAAGIASVVVAFGTTIAATVVSPGFAWTDNALSELGAATTAVGTPVTVALFNGGLVTGGLVGLVFAWHLARTGTSGFGRLTGVSFALTTASMGSVGVFPIGSDLHAPVAIAYFLLISVTLALAGATGLRRDRVAYGATSVGLAGLNLAIWVGWVLAGGPDAVGLAVPEIASSALFVGWIVLTVRRWPLAGSPGGSLSSRTAP